MLEYGKPVKQSSIFPTAEYEENVIINRRKNMLLIYQIL